KHHVHSLVEQAALDGVVVVLQEGFDQLFRLVELPQLEVDHQLEFENGELAAGRVVVKLDPDHGGNLGVVIQLAFFKALEQRLQAVVVQAVQVEDVVAEKQRLVGVIPDQVFDGIYLGITRHQNAARGGAQVVVHGHVRFLAHAFENAEQRGR